MGGGLGIGMMWTTIGSPHMIVGVYLPALIIVQRRPITGNAPAWLERIVSRFPAWLTGTAAQPA